MKDLIKNNHRALEFSQFTSHLALIRKELEEEEIDYIYVDGSMTAEEQNTQVKIPNRRPTSAPNQPENRWDKLEPHDSRFSDPSELLAESHR